MVAYLFVLLLADNEVDAESLLLLALHVADNGVDIESLFSFTLHVVDDEEDIGYDTVHDVARAPTCVGVPFVGGVPPHEASVDDVEYVLDEDNILDDDHLPVRAAEGVDEMCSG